MKKIMIFDDDSDLTNLMQSFLTGKSFSTIAFNSVDSSITETVESEKPDLVIMDLDLPEIGGEKAIQLLKSNTGTAHIPVLIFSGSPHAFSVAGKVNSNGVIAKPFGISVLLEEIQKILVAFSVR
jgi:DNA-binding response OmpR family regulator